MQLMESESFGTGVLSVIHPFAESEEKWQDTTLRRSRDSDARRNNKINAGLEQFTVPTEQVAHLGKQSFVMVIKTGPSFVIVSIFDFLHSSARL